MPGIAARRSTILPIAPQLCASMQRVTDPIVEETRQEDFARRWPTSEIRTGMPVRLGSSLSHHFKSFEAAGIIPAVGAPVSFSRKSKTFYRKNRLLIITCYEFKVESSQTLREFGCLIEIWKICLELNGILVPDGRGSCCLDQRQVVIYSLSLLAV
ncbi:MAG: hypothetical protein E6Q76_03470 [Rhizobium sp.]|nr:MAG: hypothetical protein E6Q76_03470 [Rhizobium sp.]